MKPKVKNYDVLKANLAQIKYDAQEMEAMTKAIERARDQIIEFKGRPKEETLKQAIELWAKRYEEHKFTFEIYIERFKKIDNKI
jgi:ribosomal 50S subunit-associated protein YjgA (DUF615 family)